MHMYREIFEQPAVLRTLYGEKRRGDRGDCGRRRADTQYRNRRARVLGPRRHLWKYLLEILTGVPVSLAACSVVTAYKTEMDYSGSLVIGLSQSGAAEDVAQVLERRGPAARSPWR